MKKLHSGFFGGNGRLKGVNKGERVGDVSSNADEDHSDEEISLEKRQENDRLLQMLQDQNGPLNVINRLDSFKHHTKREIAREIVLFGFGRDVVENIGKFDGVDHDEIARMMLAQGLTEANILMKVIGNLRNLSKSTAEMLIDMDEDFSRAILRYRDSFLDLPDRINTGDVDNTAK